MATLSILDVAKFLFGTVDEQIAFLQQKGLLATGQTCVCSAAMALRRKSDLSDDYIFRLVAAKPLNLSDLQVSSVRANCLFRSGWYCCIGG